MSKALLLVAGVCALFVALALPAGQADRRGATEAELRQLTQRIQQVQRQVQRDTVEKDRISRDLRDAEKQVAGAQGELTKLRAERAERAAARRKLVAERTEREAERSRTEQSLAAQLRAAYFMGRNEPAKLLLNQRSPAEFSRNLTYYGYLGRERAGQIDQLNENIAQIEELAAQIDEEDAKLAELEARQKERVGELDAARRQRGTALASLEREARDRSTSLQRMQRDKQQLERLLAELRRAAESVPFDPNSPFAQLRGKLAWPVAGRIAVNYGANRTGGLRSDGVEINAARGAEIRAVQEGRVIHADWLSGRGHVVILDHGNQFWSLYMHAEQLFAQPGARVAVGQVIATAGDSGGRKDPGLYFEIRQAGKPVDPRPWFRTPAPPAR